MDDTAAASCPVLPQLTPSPSSPCQLYGRNRFPPSSSSSSSSSRGGKKGPAGLSEEVVEEIREAFHLFDANKSGSIDLRELKAAMRALGFDVSKEEMKAILHQLGKDTSPSSAAAVTVTLDEFTQLMAGRMPARDSKEEVMKVFRLFDEEGSGYITFRALKKVCQELGEGLSEEEMQEMIDEADRDQDGKISFEEFFRVMKKRYTAQAQQRSSPPRTDPPSTTAASPPPQLSLPRGDNPLDDWDSGQTAATASMRSGLPHSATVASHLHPPRGCAEQTRTECPLPSRWGQLQQCRSNISIDGVCFYSTIAACRTATARAALT